MKIAISNLAWDRREDEKIIPILKRYQIKGVEIAPTKIWESPTKTDKQNIEGYKSWWLKQGIEIVATTSLLFEHPELTLFQDADTRKKTLEYLKKIIEVSSILGAKAMVFGSPKNRIKGDLALEEALHIATDFFRRVGEHAEKFNVYFGIEPNPPLYGADFITTTQEAIELVRLVNHPNFRINLDASTMTINREDYQETLKAAVPLAKHFHISEPDLKPIPQEGTDHKALASALKDSGYSGWVSIEMPLQDSAEYLKRIEKSLEFVTKTYRNSS